MPNGDEMNRDEYGYAVGFCDGVLWAQNHSDDMVRFAMTAMVGKHDRVLDFITSIAAAAAKIMTEDDAFERMARDEPGYDRGEIVDRISSLSVRDFEMDPRRN